MSAAPDGNSHPSKRLRPHITSVRRRPGWWLLPIPAVYLVLLAILPSSFVVPASSPSADPSGAVSGLLIAALFLFCSAVCVRAAIRVRRTPGVLRRVSLALFVAFSAFHLNVVMIMIASAGPPEATGPYLACSATHAVSTVAMLVAVFSFPGPHRTRREWRGLVLDVLTVAGSGALICWYFFVGPVLHRHGTNSAAVVAMASMPVMDLVGGCGALLALLRGATTGRRTLGYLVVGNLIVTLPGLSFAYKITHGMDNDVVLPVIVVMVTGMTLLAVATVDHLAACTRNREMVETSEPLPGISNVPYLAFLAGFALLALATVEHGTYPWPGLVAGTALMTSGIGIRQIMTIHDNQRLATTDPMTGVANRMCLTLALERALDRTQRTGVPACVLLFDLNEFKQVNDTLGHKAGDVVLTTFAAALRRNVLGTDKVGRLGGDEFAVVLNAIRNPQDAVLGLRLTSR